MKFPSLKECLTFTSGCLYEAVGIVRDYFRFVCGYVFEGVKDEPRSVVVTSIDKSLIPVKATKGSAGYDLLAANGAPLLLMPGESIAVPTGVFLDIPEGYEVQIRARSGIARRFSVWLTNGIGTVDSDYKDEVIVLLYNGGRDPFRIEPRDRIAQMVVVKLSDVGVKGAWIRDTERGGGFGSTGVR